MSNRFYARGKILLTSEYVVLHGAMALAVPLQMGQSLQCIDKREKGILNWNAMHEGKSWFNTRIQLSNLSIVQASSGEKASKLIQLLESCIELHPGFLEDLHTWDVATDLEFNPNYGFGSSSTLISLLGQWAKIDPVQLHRKVSNGSGYDLACASADSALLYKIADAVPSIQSVHFDPPFADKLWLVYQGKKQRSDESVRVFLNDTSASEIDPDFFSGLTEDILISQTVEEFGSLVNLHEKQLSEILSLPPVGKLYHDFDGYVKSLGAWGGDFAIFASDREAAYVEEYLRNKHLAIYFRYKEVVIS